MNNKDVELKYGLIDRLNCLIDQAKYIRNTLVNNSTNGVLHIMKKDLDELVGMANDIGKLNK